MTVYDLHGRPMKAPTRRELTEELAAPTLGGVRQALTGVSAAGLTPDRLATTLRAAHEGDADRYLELAETMEERDLHYSSVLGTRKRGIRMLEPRVEAASEAAIDEEAAELVRQVFEAPSIADDLIDMLDALGKGYSVTEILWNLDGKLWTVAALEWRPPHFFRFDRATGRQVLLRDGTGEVPLAPWKFITHFARAKSGLPIRGGLAMLAAWAYLFKSYTIRDWAIFCEAYGHPLRLGRYGPEASETDRRTLLRAVQQIGVDMAAIVPESMTMEIIEGAKVGADKLFETAARYWDEQVSKGVLGQTGTTDALAGGYAVGKVHDGVRDDIRDSDAAQLAATLTRDLIGPLVALNFGDRAGMPRLRFMRPEVTDPRLLLQALKLAVPMGLRVATADIYRAFGISPPEEGDELLTPPPRAAAPPEADPDADPEDAGEEPPVPAARMPHDHATSLDDLVASLIDEGHAAPATEGLLGGIAEAIGSARSMDEVRARLAEFADMAPDAALAEMIARVTFAGRIAGETGADIGGN